MENLPATVATATTDWKNCQPSELGKTLSDLFDNNEKYVAVELTHIGEFGKTESDLIFFNAIKSSNIKGVGFRPYASREGSLYVLFNTGSLYEYMLVPVKLYLDLTAAESKGKFINSQIKPNYGVEKVC